MLENVEQELTNEITRLKNKIELYKSVNKIIIPVKVYTCKSRKNTTVIFGDGSSMTVKRKEGDKDCLETAIAYCIMNQLMPKSYLRKLIKEREEK